MAFNANKSDEAVVKEGKLYTGLANMKVIAINPTKSQLEELGYKPQNDPVYNTRDGETEKLRLDVFLGLENDDSKIMTKVAFFLENSIRKNKNGDKAEWINDFGRTAWGTLETPPSDLKWFDSETARPCKIGESDVHTFLVNWLNISPNDEAKLENFEGLFSGDYSELNGLLESNSDNEIRVLLTVRDGKYQSIYNKYFDRATNKRNNYWESHMKKQTEGGYPPK